jgi:hypothetical protein
MPRRVDERLDGYSFGVVLRSPSNGDQEATAAEIVFVDHPDGPFHTVTIPLTVRGKALPIAQLTGGIEVASEVPAG